MRIGDFGLSIEDSEGHVLPGDENGYVVLRHGEHYSLVLENHSGGCAALYARLDERDISGGEAEKKIMIRPGTTTLERIPDDHGRFTFYAAGSHEAAAAGEAAVAKGDKGIVQVKFVPERRQDIQQDDYEFLDLEEFDSSGWRSSPATRDSGSYGAGMTGLSGHSSQRFHTVASIDEDEGRAVTITLRLVHDKTATDGPRPLPGRQTGNSVPPPVE